jgi:hypothetical protein
MLREISKVRQVAGEPTRRWYMDEYFDLVIWQMEGGEIVGFQLCYDKQRGEHALTWQSGSGFSHHEVDSGENRPGKYKATPILVEDGTFNMEEIALKFLGHSDALESQARDFIYNKLLQYPVG